MSGEPESKVDEKIKEVDKVLDDYARALGTIGLTKDKDIENILSASHDEIKSQDSETIGIWSFRLARYSGFLQKEINRQMAKNKWADHNIKIVVAKYQANYGDKYTKYEYKRDMVIDDNAYAKELNKLFKETMLRVEELNFISTRVNTMSNILLDISKSKRYGD